MTVTMACSRCSKLGEIHVHDEEGEIVFDGTVDSREGTLFFVCNDCLTDNELFQQARQSAVAMLDEAENFIATMDMVFKRIPALQEDAKAQEAYAEAQQQAQTAREVLASLMVDDDDQEKDK